MWSRPLGSGLLPIAETSRDKQARAAALPTLYRMTAGSSHGHARTGEKSTRPKPFKISKDAGYKGVFSIDAPSRNSPDPYAAVQTILDILLANM